METINRRIYLIRKYNDLSQKEFATQIGLKRNSICELEKDGRTVTDRNISIICQVYNINPQWLMNGEGEMFAPDSSLDTYAQKYNLTGREKKLFEELMELDSDLQKSFFDFLEATLTFNRCVEKNEKELKLVGYNGSKTIKISNRKIKEAAKKDSCSSENNDNSLF